MSGHVSATALDSNNRSHRFCGGRKALNARRAMLAQQRRRELVDLMRSADLGVHGWRSRLAETMGVHRGTICRDLKILADEAREQAIAAADADLDRRFLFLSMLQRSTDPDQSRARVLRNARETKAEAGVTRKPVANYAKDYARDSDTARESDGGDRDGR